MPTSLKFDIFGQTANIVMGFDQPAFLGATFQYIRINGALHQEVNLT